MTIQSISAATIPSVFSSFRTNRQAAARSQSTSDVRPSKEIALRGKREDENELIRIDAPSQLRPFDASSALANLRFRSQVKVRQTDDSLQIRQKSRLKFDYEFQSEDGTKVKLSAKVKTNFAYEQTGDDSFELKARVKLQLSFAYESVQSGLAPALDSDAVSGEQGDALRETLASFGSLVDELSSGFQDGSIFGDDLVAKLVDAFNGVVETVEGELPESLDEPLVLPLEPRTIDPPTPPVGVLEASVIDAPVIESDVEVGDDPAIENIDQAADTTTADEFSSLSQLAEIAAADTDVDDEVDGDSDADAVPRGVEAETPEVNEPTLTRSSILTNLRLNFVQSLSSLVTVLESPDSEGERSSTTIRQQSRFSFRLQAQQSQLSNLALSGRRIDTTV